MEDVHSTEGWKGARQLKQNKHELHALSDGRPIQIGSENKKGYQGRIINSHTRVSVLVVDEGSQGKERERRPRVSIRLSIGTPLPQATKQRKKKMEGQTAKILPLSFLFCLRNSFAAEKSRGLI